MASGGLLATIHSKPAQSYAQETSELETDAKRIPPQKDRVFDLVRPTLHGSDPAAQEQGFQRCLIIKNENCRPRLSFCHMYTLVTKLSAIVVPESCS